jgi:hypothetical protein
MSWLLQLKNLNSFDKTTYLSDYDISTTGCNPETKKNADPGDQLF